MSGKRGCGNLEHAAECRHLDTGNVIGRGQRATAEEIHVLLRDALNVYDDAVSAQADSPVWAGEENAYARTWLRQRSTIAMALRRAIEATPPDVLKLTLTHGADIEI